MSTTHRTRQFRTQTLVDLCHLRTVDASQPSRQPQNTRDRDRGGGTGGKDGEVGQGTGTGVVGGRTVATLRLGRAPGP